MSNVPQDISHTFLKILDASTNRVQVVCKLLFEVFQKLGIINLARQLDDISRSSMFIYRDR
jgi:hypothetical protein